MAQNTLFKFPERKPSTKAEDLLALQKVKSKPKQSSAITVKGGTGIMAKIQAINELVRRMIGEDDGTLICIKDEAEFRRYIAKAKENGELALDTETDGLNNIDDAVAGICIYTPDMKPAYVPINHINYITGAKVDGQIPAEVITEELNNLGDTKVIFHNAKFDLHVIKWQLNVQYDKINLHWDTMIAGFLLNENEEHNLKYLYEKYVARSGKKANELASYTTLFEGMPFTKVPLETAFLYGAKDPYMTYMLYKYQQQFLDADSPLCKKKDLDRVAWLYKNIELPVIKVTAQMESNGVNIDTPYAKELSAKYTKELQRAEQVVYGHIDKLADKLKELSKKNPASYQKLDHPININSNPQLAVILYDVMGLESPDSEKPRGTGEEILETFDTPLAKAILDYRTLAKLLSTYIDKLPSVLNKRTRKIHASFNQYGARTGRYSSSDPNLQNIPSHNKDVRKMFTASNFSYLIPADAKVVSIEELRAQKFLREHKLSGKYVLVGGDFSQQEPRVLAFMSQDENMIAEYAKGTDIYAWIASIVFHVDYTECKEFRPDGTKNPEGKKRRDKIKAIVLGIMYGKGAKNIGIDLGISKKEAQGIIDTLFEKFPKVKKFIDDSQQHARDYGFVETAYGRKCRLPDMQLLQFEFHMLNSDEEVPEYVVHTYSAMLAKTFSTKEKNKIKAKAKAEGIHIKDNGGFIAQAERQCVNSIIQGSAADITKKAMIVLANDLKLMNWGYRMLMTVHDEIIGECPIEYAKQASERVSLLMIGSCSDRITVPMKTDIEVTDRWYGEAIAL